MVTHSELLRRATDDEDETAETPTPTNAELARMYAQQWAVEAALNPQPEDTEENQ